MPTPVELTHRLAASNETLRACKKALMPKGLKHPRVTETAEDAHGGVVIDRRSYYAALAALAEYEERVGHLGGKNAADVEPAPEVTHKGDEAAIEAVLEELEA
jgi:hypothetical protein